MLEALNISSEVTKTYPPQVTETDPSQQISETDPSQQSEEEVNAKIENLRNSTRLNLENVKRTWGGQVHELGDEQTKKRHKEKRRRWYD